MIQFAGGRARTRRSRERSLSCRLAAFRDIADVRSHVDVPQFTGQTGDRWQVTKTMRFGGDDLIAPMLMTRFSLCMTMMTCRLGVPLNDRPTTEQMLGSGLWLHRLSGPDNIAPASWTTLCGPHLSTTSRIRAASMVASSGTQNC